jgi:leishmanolysin-like peptidase
MVYIQTGCFPGIGGNGGHADTINVRMLQVCRTCNSTGQDCGMMNSSRGAGIDGADFVFYVSAMETERCHKGMTVAYAAHCQQEAALDR